MPESTAKIEIGSPKVLTTAGVLLIYAHGLLMVVPFVLTVLVISLLKFGVLTWLIPVAVALLTAIMLPFTQGNARVVKAVRSFQPNAGRDEHSFIVQLTFSPRLRSGFRALLEDADDIGCLSLAGSELVFHGDSVKLAIPFDQIESIGTQSVGLRGLYGPRIALVVPDLPNVASLEFAERSAWLLSTSRKTTRRLYEQLAARLEGSPGQ